MAIEVNKTNIRDILDKPLVLLDFWAPWCMPCNRMTPVIEELSGEYAGRVLVGKVNIEENQELAAEHRIMSIPNMILFKDGEPVDSVVGAVPKEKIKSMLDKYLTD